MIGKLNPWFFDIGDRNDRLFELFKIPDFLILEIEKIDFLECLNKILKEIELNYS